MKLLKLSTNWTIAALNNRGLLVANIAMAITIPILAVMAFTQRERVVLVPPHLDKRVEVSWNAASGDYYKGWGLYVATLMGNLTPKNVKFTADVLSPMFAPEVYAPIRTKMLALLDDPNFVRANAFNFFTPRQVIYEAELKRVFVSGFLVTSAYNYVSSGSASDTKPVVYEMDFTMRSGLPVITRFDSYEGTQPHTQAWLSKNPNWREAEAKRKEEIKKRQEQYQ